MSEEYAKQLYAKPLLYILVLLKFVTLCFSVLLCKG